MEKAYRDFGHDMDNLDTLAEVGLGFTANFETQRRWGSFIGQRAVEGARASGGPPCRRLIQVLLRDPGPLMHHAEVR